MLETRNHPRLRPAPSDSTRTFGRPRVYFPFTRCNRVGCGSDSNPIRPEDSRTLHSWPFSLTLSYLLTLNYSPKQNDPSFIISTSCILLYIYYRVYTINIKNQNIELKPRTQKPIPHKERETERESLKLSNPQSQWKNA